MTPANLSFWTYRAVQVLFSVLNFPHYKKNIAAKSYSSQACCKENETRDTETCSKLWVKSISLPIFNQCSTSIPSRGHRIETLAKNGLNLLNVFKVNSEDTRTMLADVSLVTLLLTLILLCRRSLSHRNQSIDLQSK